MIVATLIEQRFGDGGSYGGAAPENALLQQVLARKTVRRYSDRKPEENLIDLLQAAALSASTKSDFQQVSILRLMDTGKRAALGALIPKMPWIIEAPVFFVFLADARRLQRVADMRGRPVYNGSLEGFFNASVDSALALQTMILCAENVGLGTCPISALRNHAEEAATLLDLPDLVFPIAGLCMGYPAGEGHVSLRLPRQLTLHRDRYDDSTLPQAIDSYDRRRDQRHSIPREQHRANARFGEALFYGWSEDKARQAADAEGASFPAFLRAHGFTFLS